VGVRRSALRAAAQRISGRKGIIPQPKPAWSRTEFLGLSFGTNQSRFWGGFPTLSDAESMYFHCVPNQVLYQAEPLPDFWLVPIFYYTLRCDTPFQCDGVGQDGDGDC